MLILPINKIHICLNMSSLHLLTSRNCLNSTADYAAQLEARAMASNLQTLWGSIGKNH